MKPSPRNLTSFIWLGVFNSIAILFFAGLPSVANAQSTERSNPIPLTSKRLPGNIAARDDTPYFYSFLGGPGKISIKLIIQKQEEYAYLQLQAFDQQQRSLLTLEGSSIDREKVGTLQLGTQQVIILQLKSVRSSASGSYVLSLDGPVSFNPSLASSGSPGAAQPPATPKDTRPPTITILSPEVTREQVVRVKTCNITLKGRVSDESQIGEVEVNGAPVSLDGKNEFSTNLTLRYGDNRIFATATDIHGNKAREDFGVTCENSPPIVANSPATTSSPVFNGRYFALLIGVENYKDKRIQKLDHPLNDTRRLRKVLIERYTFAYDAVEILENPTRAELFAKFKQLREKLTANDLLLVFYAGHGEFDESKDEGYWLPSDAEKDLSTQWFSNSDLCNEIRDLKTRHILLITDSCFSGSLVFKGRSLFDDAPPAIQETYEMKSRKAITSGALKTVPDKSVFIDYLVRRLEENKDDYLTAVRLFAALGEAVTNNSPNRQKPLYGPIYRVGDEGGDFIFVRRK